MQKQEKKSKLLSFFAFFFFLCVFFSFFCLRRKKMPRRKCLKQKGRNRRPKIGAKSERIEQKLKGKLPSFFTFYFFFLKKIA